VENVRDAVLALWAWVMGRPVEGPP
jgi:hypothetical protein